MPSIPGLVPRRARKPVDAASEDRLSRRMPVGRRPYSVREAPLLWDSALSVEDQLRIEIQEMTKFAMASGHAIPEPVARFLAEHPDLFDEDPPDSQVDNLVFTADNIPMLFQIHQTLAQIVVPATPGTIRILANEERRNRYFRFLGPVPLVHHMVLVAVLGLAAFIGLSLVPSVDASNDLGEISGLSGADLLFNQLFFLAAAAVGASFEALFRANRFVVNGTYDPKYQPSYWIRFILGLIAGLILALLIPIGTETTQTVTRPLLALLGGFSSPIAYRLLSRLVSTVESLFGGDPQELAATREQSTSLRMAELQRQLAELRLRPESQTPPDGQSTGNAGSIRDPESPQGDGRTG